MSYLRYLCLLAHSGVQHILCCVATLFCCSLSCVSYVADFFWIVHLWLPLRYSSNVYSSPSSSSTLAMIVSFIHGSSSALKLKIHEYIFKCFLYTGLTLFEIMVTLIFRFVRYDQNASKPLISSKQKQKHLIRKQKGVLFYFFDTYFLFLRDWHYIA